MYKPSNDNIRRSVGGGTPLGTRLSRERREADLRRYIRYRTITAEPTWLSATSNLPEVGSKPQPDRVTEIKPTIGELARISNQIKAGEEGVRANAQDHIIEWRGADGKFRPVIEMYRQPKGKRRKSKEEPHGDIARYLAVRGGGGLPERCQRSTTPSEGEDFRRLRAAHWVQAMGVANDNARLDIDRAGVGSRHSFDEAWANAGLYPACRVPRFVTGIANGMELMGYRIHSNSHATQGGVEGGHDLNERTIVETMDQTRIDAALGMHAKVLDLSIAGLTAKQIAAKLDWGSTKAAERRAAAAQDAALAALAAVETKLAA